MTDLRIPSAFTDVADALTSAASGDTIILEEAGSPYAGNANKNANPTVPLTFRGEGTTVIVDLGNDGRFIDCGADITVENMEVRNGNAGTLTPPGDGGAIKCEYHNLTTNDMVFRANRAQGGGAIRVTGGLWRGRNLQFFENVSDFIGGGAVMLGPYND